MDELPQPVPLDGTPRPGESFYGLEHRIAAALDLRPGELRTHLGLPSTETPTTTWYRLALSQGHLQFVAHGLRTTPDAIERTLLISVDGHVTTFDPAEVVDRRRYTKIVRRHPLWFRRTAACTDCLTEGRPWLLAWHIPALFACPVHHRVLIDWCPGCDTPIGSSTYVRLNSGPVLSECNNHGGNRDRCGYPLTSVKTRKLRSESKLRLAAEAMWAAFNGDPPAIHGRNVTPLEWFDTTSSLAELLRRAVPHANLRRFGVPDDLQPPLPTKRYRQNAAPPSINVSACEVTVVHQALTGSFEDAVDALVPVWQSFRRTHRPLAVSNALNRMSDPRSQTLMLAVHAESSRNL